MNTLIKLAPLLSAVATVFAALVALYLGSWREILRRPKLKLYFSEEIKYPYFHKLAFGKYPQPIDLDFVGQIINILIPGINARIKIYNKGKSTAKDVQARIEKIVLREINSKTNINRFYHPTTVKWSGEKEWGPVDIVPKSHFFLDVFWSISEKISEIIDFNFIKYRELIHKDVLKDIIENVIHPSDEVYWNVWVESPSNRGIPDKYDFQGDIIIYFLVNGENCEPIRFQAMVTWTFSTWDSPIIRIKQGNRFIYNE